MRRRTVIVPPSEVGRYRRPPPPTPQRGKRLASTLAERVIEKQAQRAEAERAKG